MFSFPPPNEKFISLEVILISFLMDFMFVCRRQMAQKRKMSAFPNKNVKGEILRESESGWEYFQLICSELN